MAKQPVSKFRRLIKTVANHRLAKTLNSRIRGFLARRPHRSFRLTRRRDYRRSLELPGYLSFSLEVLKVLASRKYLWLGVAAVYLVIGLALGGFTSQATYQTIGSTLEESVTQLAEGDVGQLSQAGLLALAAFSGSAANIGEAQQVYFGLLAILIWLTTVWLLREHLAGRRPSIRDGLYSSGAPLVPTFLVSIVLILQLLPIGLMAIVYTAVSSTGLIDEGFGAFISFVIAVLAIALTLYWLTATFISLIVVTLPGMYPFQALRTGGDLVVGRRLRIMYRLLWLTFSSLVSWFLVIIPAIALDRWLVGIWQFWENIPIVPLVAAALSSLLMIYAASYIYLLYRKVVDDDAAPA